MSGGQYITFGFRRCLEEALRDRDLVALRRLAAIASERVKDADEIPWPALSASWRRDAREVRAWISRIEMREAA